MNYLSQSVLLFVVVAQVFSCAKNQSQNFSTESVQRSSRFYASHAKEYKVSFKAILRTQYTNLEEFGAMTASQKSYFEKYILAPTTQYLFGPLTNRDIGGEQKGTTYDILWNEAQLVNSLVEVPYIYHGQWIVNDDVDVSQSVQIPLPYNDRVVFSDHWKQCTDLAPEHQTPGFYWYFWDPSRYGCDHKLGKEYQMIQPEFTEMTKETTLSYPEYAKMVRGNKVSMTFAFGYVEEAKDPNPFKDSDYGMGQFRSFISMVKKEAAPYKVKVTSIIESEYLGAVVSDKVIGQKFSFTKNGIDYEVKVVASGDLDQMELFAKSFSHDRDAFFGWFGHSRVGNGFDAEQFKMMSRRNPSFYSATKDYQVVYWAGCNSYSYYTKPFFEFKAQLNAEDPSGTKSLDIISNGLPSQFSLNAVNAKVLLQALTRPEEKASYQQIVTNIENLSGNLGLAVLVNVLGDEDNN